jgi:hypothetical protein
MVDFNTLLQSAFRDILVSVLKEPEYENLEFTATQLGSALKRIEQVEKRLDQLEQTVAGLSALAQAAAIAFPPEDKPSGYDDILTAHSQRLLDLTEAVKKLVQVPQPEGGMTLADPLKNYIDTVIEQSMDVHNEVYNHDDFYDDREEIKDDIGSWVESVAKDVMREDLDDSLRLAFRNATISVEF